MKVSDKFELREILGEHIVMPKGDKMSDFSGTIVLTDASAFAWEKLQMETTKEEVLSAVLEEFEVSREVAEKDLDHFLEQLRSFGVLEE